MIHASKKIVIIALVGGLLSACAADGTGINKQTVGTGMGAVLGGLAGSTIGGGKGRLIAVGAGTLLGALVGSSIGSSLDKADMTYANQAMSQAHSAPVGETISWSNPQSGNRGSYTPIQTGRTADNRVCRKYEQTIIVQGRAETGVGTACQNNDGTWQIING
jgi:surface antigen